MRQLRFAVGVLGWIAAIAGHAVRAAAQVPAAAPAAPGAASPAVVEYAIPTPGAFPHDPAVDPLGRVWYTDQANSRIGRLDPETGAFTAQATPTPASAPYGIAIGPDGRIWFHEVTAGDVVAFDPRDGSMQRVPIPTRGAIVRNMAVDRGRGRIWLALSGTGRIGRIDVPARGGAVRP